VSQLFGHTITENLLRKRLCMQSCVPERSPAFLFAIPRPQIRMRHHFTVEDFTTPVR
jgi:hypothetical protein